MGRLSPSEGRYIGEKSMCLRWLRPNDTALVGYVPALQEGVCKKKRQAEDAHRQLEAKYEAAEEAARLAEGNGAEKQRYHA